MDRVHRDDDPFCSCFVCLAEMAQFGILQPIAIPMEDAPLHTKWQPFCSDLTCPCHRDKELIDEHLNIPHWAGLLTSEEGVRLLTGQQL